jgi:hypothetical protein
MAGDKDFTASLPDPPPPSPARREAAIGEAMRRFDGKPAAPERRPEPARGASWIRRPQFGLAMTIALMAVVGLPMTWLAIKRGGGRVDPATYSIAVSTKNAPSASTGGGRLSPSERLASKTGTELVTRSIGGAADVGAPPGQSGATNAVARTDARVNETTAQAPPAIVADAEPSAAPMARFAPPPPPPPPPSLPAPAVAARAMVAAAPPVPSVPVSEENILVTGARVASSRAGRGSWNACTISDPKQSLAMCRRQIGVGAAGTKGVAAAHLADGLRLAWQGDQDGALRAFSAAIALNAKFSQAYINRSLLYSRMGDEDRALADAETAVHLGHGTAQAYYVRSILLRRQGNTARALADEERALLLDPSYSEIIER